jgi:hypothetical protein
VDVVTFHGLDLIAAASQVMAPRPASERLVDAAIAIVGDRRPDRWSTPTPAAAF